ncbi:MAG: chemotaxis-specific protein-glutamate methyltransferase CheB [Chroococcales cyanobacterium]
MPIRVLLVEDSPVALVILKRILSASPDIEVVGTAKTGYEALELIPKVQPNVICTDLHMPQMDGLELTKEVMSRYPRPILVISASVQEEDTQNVFRLLEAGAVDILPKPRSGLAYESAAARQELINKIKVLSGVSVFTQHRRLSSIPETRVERKVTPQAVSPVSRPTQSQPYFGTVKMVTIGASTGGPQALHTILTQIPPKFPVPVVCVQHISEGFLQGLVDWLAVDCRLPVKIAEAGEFPKPGVIYFPMERRHLELDSQGRFKCTMSPPVGGHCPSVTVTFKAIARYYGRSSMGILLTGMGRDGAEGLLEMANAGALTIAQDEKSCVVFGMPKEAIALGAAKHVLPLPQIAPMLLKQVIG